MSAFAESLARLRERFLARAREDLATFAAHAAGEAPLPPEALRAAAHRLAGAAGTFGFADLSVAAGDLEDAVLDGRADQASCVGRLCAALEQVVGESLNSRSVDYAPPE